MNNNFFYKFELPNVPKICKNKEPTFEDLDIFIEKFKYILNPLIIKSYTDRRKYISKYKKYILYQYTTVNKNTKLTNKLLEKTITLRENAMSTVYSQMETVPYFVKSIFDEELELLILLLNTYYKNDTLTNYDNLVLEFKYMPGNKAYLDAKKIFQKNKLN